MFSKYWLILLTIFGTFLNNSIAGTHFPCSVNDEGKVAIVNLIEETKNKLLQIITDVYNPLTHLNIRAVSTNEGENPKGMESENKRLKRELFIAKAKLDSFTANLLTFKINKQRTLHTRPSNSRRGGVHKPPSHSEVEKNQDFSPGAFERPDEYQDFVVDNLVKPMVVQSKSGHIVECISMEDFQRLNEEISKKGMANSELTAKFNELSDQIQNLISISVQPVDESS